MKKKLLILTVLGLVIAGCNNNNNSSMVEESSSNNNSSDVKDSSSIYDGSSSSSEESSSVIEESSSVIEESSSISDVHTHKYNENGICECGQSKPGAYKVTVDGSFADWPSEVKTKKLETFGDDSRGFSVMAFTDDSYMFSAVSIVSTSNVIETVEIVYKDGKNINISYDSENNSYFATGAEDNAIVTFYVTQTLDAKTNLYTTNYEYILNKSVLADENGNVKCGFDVNVPNEESKASYSSEQIAYWVLYGINAWSTPDYVTITNSGINHNHIYDSNYKCIICGEEKGQSNYKITVDGDISDWSKDVLSSGLVTTDGEERHFKVYGFMDDNYVYIFASISHYSEHVGTFEVLALVDGAWKENYVINNGSTYTYNSKTFEMGKVKEYADDETLLNVTDIELVLNKADLMQGDGSVKLGFSSNLNSETSSELGFSDTQASWWVLGKTNSWSASDHFEITTAGIKHKHKYDANDKCYFCGEEKPISYAITVDGDNKDWPANVLNNTIKTYGEEKTGFEVSAFLDDKFYYVYSKIVSKTDKVNCLEILAKGNSADILFRLNDAIPAGVLQYKWTQNLVDGFYITTFETVIDKSIVANDDGTVKAAYDVNVEEKSKASFSDDNIAYWNIAKTNAWNVNDHLLVDANGIHHTHKYDENNTCMFCEEKKANETITVDGNSLDWNADVLNTKLASTGNDNQSFEVVSVVKGDTVYFFVTLKCKSNTQNTLSVVFNCATEFKVVYNANGLASKTDNVKEAAAIVTFDETLNVYVGSVEFAIAKDSITNENNQVKVGIDCWTSDADDKLGFEASGVNAMWWLINGHNSWDVNTNFVVTENGIAK